MSMPRLAPSVLSLARKDLLLLWRDRVGFFFVFGFPLLIAIFFGLVFSGPGSGPGARLPIVVVDRDGSEASGALLHSLGASDSLSVEVMETPEAARARVRSGARVASIEIEPGFGSVDLPRRVVSRDAAPGVVIAIDPARQAEAGLLRGVVTREAFAALAPPGDASLASNPVPVRLERAAAADRNAFLVTFPQGLVWGVMACAAGFGVSLVAERRGGTLARIRSGPTPAWAVLAGKATACFVGNVALAVVLLVVGAIAFGLLSSASLVALVLAVLSVALGFVGLMMLLAVCGKTESAAGGVGWAVLLVLAMVGGAMAPRFLMPAWLDVVGGLSPVRWAIEAYEGAIWRGWTLSQMVWPCAKLIVMGAATFTLGARLMTRRD
ncbi:MAG: ABC transporter permease [Planctomycetota bacterium]